MIADFTRSELQEVVKYQRLVLLSVLIDIIIVIVLIYIILFAAPSAVQLHKIGEYLSKVFFVVYFLQIFAIYKLSISLKFTPLCRGIILSLMVLTFMPFSNIFILIFMNNKATKILKAAGLKVGLMGVKPDSIKI